MEDLFARRVSRWWSYYQRMIVSALIRNEKNFDLLFVPGSGHGAGGYYGQRLHSDFFVHERLGQEPPDWNETGDMAGVDDRRR